MRRPEELELNFVPPQFLQIEAWKSLSGLAHGFGTRHPGREKPSRKDWLGRAVQTGPESFPLLSLRQVHGTGVVLFDPARQTVGEIWKTEGDALLTRTPGVALGVFTADCLPVMLYDPVRKAIGLVHAGWRGTAKGVVRAALEGMKLDFGSRSEDIRAALGPCIGPCCYEVDAPVREAFLAGGIPWERVSRPRGDSRWLLDLYEANLYQLDKVGILKENTNHLKICTRCREDTFYSYRNADKTGGRQLNFVALRKESGVIARGDSGRE